MKRSILIGIAGGSGSGKTLVAQTLLKDIGSDKVVSIQQDSYYKDLSYICAKEREKVNFDHPDAIDSDLLIQHMKQLLRGQAISQPIYDFKQHIREKETKRIGPCSIVVIEGILILYYPKLRALMDIKIYVDTDSDIRFVRRLLRDMKERGRTMESVIQQYEKTVRPMYQEFVEPTKRFADLIIPEGGYNLVAIDILKSKLKILLKKDIREGI